MKATHSGTSVQATDYGVWGDVIREQKSDVATYRYGYQGQFAERDEETGWNHFELREYDPVTGRWLVPDPYRQHWSPYVAMGNNPVGQTDPDGSWADPNPTPMLPELVVTGERAGFFGRFVGFFEKHGGKILDGAQTALDVVGLIPGVGEIADLANAGIYALRGDYTNASLSLAAAVPFAGWGATGVKLGLKIAAAVPALKVGKKMMKYADEISQL